MTSSSLAFYGRLRYILSTATPSTSPCVIGSSIISVGCFVTAAMVFPMVSILGCFPMLVTKIWKLEFDIN